MAYVRDAVKGQTAGLGSFLSGGGKYYIKVLFLGLAVSLIVGVFVLLAALAGAFLQDKPFISVPLMILCAAFGVYFAVLLFLSPYAIVADEKGVGTALKLSIKLVKKNILKLLGISGLLVLIGFGIGLLLGGVLAGISIGIKDEKISQLVFSFPSSFVNSFLGVFVTAAFMNFYLSLPDRNNI